MANKLHKLLNKAGQKEKFLVVCGARHMAYGHGLPERLFKNHAELKKQTCTLISRETDWNLPEIDAAEPTIDQIFGGSKAPADFVLVTETPEIEGEEEEEEEKPMVQQMSTSIGH